LVHGGGHFAQVLAARKPSKSNWLEALARTLEIRSRVAVSMRDSVPQWNAIFQFYLPAKVDEFWCRC
jgi:hypothetical protein